MFCLRDDKSFPKYSGDQRPRLPDDQKASGCEKAKRATTTAPLRGQVPSTARLINCNGSFCCAIVRTATFETRTRPCLQYQIKRCSGPCCGLVSEADYEGSVRDAEKFLQGRTKGIQEALAKQMQDASEAMEFERAAAMRDRIKALTQVQSAQGINPQNTAEADVIALHRDGGQACVQVFFIRANQNWGNHDYYPRISGDEDASEVMEAFVGQFYSNREPPRMLILSHGLDNDDLMAEALAEKAESQSRDRIIPLARRKGRAGAKRFA